MVEHAAYELAWLLRLTLLLPPPALLCFLEWLSFPREIFAYGCSNVLLLVLPRCCQTCAVWQTCRVPLLDPLYRCRR